MRWSQFDRTRQVSDPDFSAVDWSSLPHIITLAVRLSVSHKTRTSFVQIRVAISAFEAASVPFQVRRNAENVLVLNLRAAADTHGYSTLLCKRNTKQNLRAPWSKAWQEILLSVQESHGAEAKFILTSRAAHRLTTYVEDPDRSFPRKLNKTRSVISTKMGLLTERHCQLTNRILQNSDLFVGINSLVQPARTMPRDSRCHCPVVYWPEAQPPILQIGTQLWMPHSSLVAHLSPLVKLCAFF